MQQRRLMFAIPIITAAAFQCAAAQGVSHEAGDRATLGAWIGVAQHSPPGLFGHTAGRSLALVAARFTRPVMHSPRATIDYTVDILPAAWLSASGDTAVTVRCPAGWQQFCQFNAPAWSHAHTPGFGAMPFGIQARFRPAARIEPFAGASAGAMYFRQPVPMPDAGRFNFIAAVGGGLLVVPFDGVGVQAGYNFTHISNAGTSRVNPGLDNNVFFAGVVVRVARSSAGPP